MRLSDLTKNLSDMTDEELHAHVRTIRDNKYVIKPAVKKRVADEEKKEKITQLRGVDKVLANMTPEQKLALLEQLKGGGGGN